MKHYRNYLLKTLTASSAVSVLLCIARMFWVDSLHYEFLLWNLFLAWIPFIIAWQMKLHQQRWKHYLLFVLWLLFLPNAPYIVTDLVHLQHDNGNAIYWFDMFLIFSFAWNGLILGFLSLNRIHSFLNYYFNRKFSWLLIFVLIFLCAYGIYLGRFERYNSWDIVSNPVSLMTNVFYDFRHPLRNLNAMGISLLMTMFLSVIYITLVAVKSINYSSENKK